MKIKIASNPYEQKITYSKYDEQTGEYNQITSADSSTSKLLSSDFVKCFFPFKAKDILNQLVDEYAIKTYQNETEEDLDKIVESIYNVFFYEG